MTTLKEQLDGWRPRKRVKFQGKYMNIKDILLKLEEENDKLRKNQCKPRISCLRKYEDWMDEEFVGSMD